MKKTAFTLTELLVVVAILGIVTAFSVPAFRSVSAASNLGAARQIVVAELDLARQTALSRRLPVEVRFYQLPAYGAAPTASPTAFRAVQAFAWTSTATNALDKAIYFPKPAKATTDAAASPLLQGPVSGAVKLGEVGTNYRYASVVFAPGGAVMSASTNVFLTLVLDNAAPTRGTLPADFVTIQVDPFNGRVFTYQP